MASRRQESWVMKAQAATALKIAAACISTGAALASLYASAHSWGWLRRAGVETPLASTEPNVSWIGLNPPAETLFAIGDTTHLSASVTDRHGTAVSDVPLVWTSDDPQVVSVDASGTVVSAGPGVATVIAALGEKSARARVTVKQRAAAIRLQAESTFSIPEAGHRRLEAYALDSRDYPITDLPVAWRSSDTSLVTIDPRGEVTGVAPGHTTVEARVDNFSARVGVVVKPVPTSLTLVSGGGQHALAGKRLADPLVLKVLSRSGRPVADVAVRIDAEDGMGHVDPAADTTDAEGRVHVAWTLGHLPGRQRLTASVTGVDSTVQLWAESDPSAANTRVAPNGGEPQGRVREPLAEPVTIRVTDSLGTALVDVPVAWSALDGGTVEGLDQRTDTLGQARAKWTLGPHAGQQRARVQVGNARSMPPVTIKAAAQAGPAAQLKLVSGDRQAGPVGTALPKPVTLALSDRDGNPVAGVPVRLEAEAGSISDSLGSTDASGTLQIHWTLGRSAGTQRLIAKVEGVEASTAATAEARARAAVNLEFVTPPASGVAGRALPGPVRVSVSDVYGNPVPDQTVLFTPVAGAGTASPTRVATDAHGVAGTRWTLGAKPGDQTLAASVKGTQARGTLKLKAAVRR